MSFVTEQNATVTELITVTFAICKPPERHRGKISTCIVLGISNYAQQCKENNVKKHAGHEASVVTWPTDLLTLPHPSRPGRV